MYDEFFSKRLESLRLLNGASARDMSLSIGQNPGYINSIETGKSLPSMSAFFYICDYLKITPKEFFDTESDDPVKNNEIAENLKKLTPEQLNNIGAVINDLATKNTTTRH